MSASNWSVILTVADHDQNGFVSLAIWPGLSEADARRFISDADALVSDDNEPDIKTAAFTFILDLIDQRSGMIDNGKRLLPTQVAMSLAPDQVQDWLNERPRPDDVIYRSVPALFAPLPQPA
jgi:hypothetical protein